MDANHDASRRANHNEMVRNLKSRHIIMIALGGSIGSGIFKGSTDSISVAGPGVLLSYLIGGLILFFVMQGLAEMAVNHPKARNFRELIEVHLGHFAGYLVGWVYWLLWVLVMAAETAASAAFLQYWFPNAPLWALSLVVSLAITLLNLFQVNVYGESEFWLAGIKIAVLTLFILLGGTLLFSGFGHHAATGFHHLTSHGGFFPHGLSGLAASMLVVMFSFGGTEMIGMTLGETKNPEQVVPKAARSVIVRILIFYVLPILIMVSLVPWDQLGNSNSPFVTVFEAIGIPYIGGIMNFVLLTAVLSATNTGMYAASRMLYTQALEGQAPSPFSKLSKHKVPVRALLASASFLLIGVVIAIFAKGNTFHILMVIPSYSVLLVWILLVVAHLRSHKNGNVLTGYRVKGFPYTSWFALVALLLILIGIVMTSPLMGTFVSLLTVLLIAVTYLKKSSRKHESL